MKVLFACVLMLASFAVGAREIPVGDFFKDPEFTNVSLSPTGEYITVSKPEEDRTLLAAFRVSDMKLVGKWDYGKNKHIDRVRWVNDDRFFMYVSFKVGRFDFRVGTPDVFASNVDGTKRIDVPNGGTYGIVDTLDEDPRSILVQRSVDSAFLSKMDVYTGRVTTVASSPLFAGGFLVDHDSELRYAVGMSEDRDVIILRREGNSWAEVSRTAENEVERIPLGFASDNKRVLFSVSKDGAPAGVFLVDPETGKETLLSRNQNVDVNGYVDSSDGMELLAISYLDGLLDYDFIKPDHPESKVYAGLINAFPNHAVSFQGASKDGRYILFTAYSDVDPGSYYLFDRQTAKAKFLLSARSWIKPGEMSPMKPIYFAARDGKKIHGYLTLPLGSDGKNLPMVLFIHGGPTSRDVWGFDRDAQFLASRGYAVLQVNFRGSTGYGGDFTKRGDKHWGTTMIDDMTDAVDWAIRQGIADKNRICTYGASYGGYGALQSVARNPEKYQCAIGYVGVYSLPLMFKDGDIKDSSFGVGQLRRQLPNTLAEQQAQSPAYNIDKIKIPVMLVHGAEDKRVPISHYELLKGRLTEAGRPPEVTVIEKKEGHGFYDLDNNINLYTRMEAFLNKHIGERASEATAGN